MADQDVKLFLSCVSDEFGAYRDELRRKLTRPNVEVKIQEDFKALGGDTLSMLEEYIEHCQAVVHFVGDMTGSAPHDFTVAELLARHSDFKTRLPPLGAALDAGKRISYTQWEAWLALYFRKDLEVVVPALRVRRSRKVKASDASRAAQAEHLAQLRAVGVHPNQPFTNRDNLIAQVINTSVIDALVKAAAAPVRKPRNLPFPSLGSLFMGRDADFGRLRDALAQGAPVAITGLGGVGKSRLAIEYALLYEADYSALLFVSANDPATLNANLAALAATEVLDLPEGEAAKDAAKIEAAFRWLDAHPTWLMILDNVDDEEARDPVVDLLARLRGGRVVITARASNFPAGVLAVELGALDEDAATAFLLDRTRGKRAEATEDAERARELAHELGGLALGLEQAGAYIAAKPRLVSFAGYLKLWRDNREKALKWFDPKLMGYAHEKGLAATWETSVNRLLPESHRLLDRLAMLAPDPVPNSLIDVAVPGEAAEFDALEALAGLYAYSLVTPASGEDSAAKGFVMHRLVQDFARRAMTEERRRIALREALEWISGAFVGDPQDVQSWAVLDPLAPHVLAVARQADAAGIAAPTGTLFSRLGVLFYAKARYGEAEPLCRRALAIGEASYGPEHPDVARELGNLASLLHATNRPGEAEPLYRLALAITESYGPDRPEVAPVLNNLALLLCETNRRAEAEPLYRRTLAIWERSLGADHPKVAGGLNNLALLLKDTNRPREAEPLCRRALAIFEASCGPDHPYVATGLNNLARLLQGTNRPGEAEPLLRRALAIWEKSLGASYPQVATGLNNVAELLRETNRPGDAKPLYRRALAIFEASYGPDHPELANGLNNLALLLQATNHPGEAEPLIRRALAIDEASYGPDHPNVARDLNNLANLLSETNRSREAEPLLRRALKIDEASYGPDHPEVAIDLNNLALLLQATNRPGDAEPLIRRALGIDEASLGPDHPNVAVRLCVLAGLLDAASRLSEAEPLYQRALAIFDGSLGTDHPYTKALRKNLAALETARNGGT